MSALTAFLLAALVASCLLLVSDAFRHRAGVLGLPFLAGVGMLGFLVPQAIGVARSPGMVPEAGLNKALVMCTLCTLALYWGWQKPARPAWFQARKQRYSPGALYVLGLVLLGTGLVGFFKLASLSGGIAAHFSTSGSYTLTWSGLPVMYYFFSIYLSPGLLICSLIALRMKRPLGLIPAAMAAAIQLATIVFLGRRSNTVDFLVSIGCILYFARGWAPPRSLVLAAAPLIAIAMFLAPEYRSHSEIGGDQEKLRQIDIGSTLDGVLKGTQAEFWSLCYIVQITDENRLYQYGAGFYNTFIAYFVPKLVFGEEAKANLFIPLPSVDHIANSEGWEMPYGGVSTGPGTAYKEFWFLGAACFYFLGRFMKYLWTRATNSTDVVSQAMYAMALTCSVACLTNDMYAIYVPVFMFWVPVLWLTRARLFRSGGYKRATAAGRARPCLLAP